jgi:hypothetical protein
LSTTAEISLSTHLLPHILSLFRGSFGRTRAEQPQDVSENLTPMDELDEYGGFNTRYEGVGQHLQNLSNLEFHWGCETSSL